MNKKVVEGESVVLIDSSYRKFIIDTNVIFSALYSPNSNAGKLIELTIEKRIELHTPMEIKDELERNLLKRIILQ